MTTTTTKTGRVQGQAEAGDRVRYSDMANPGSTYVVVGPRTQTFGGEDNPYRFSTTDYEMVNVETGETNYSDCRQYGWTFA